VVAVRSKMVSKVRRMTLLSAMDTVPDCVGNDVRAMQMRRVGPFGG